MATYPGGRYKTEGGLHYTWGERIIKEAIIKKGLIDPDSRIIILKEAHAELMETLERAAREISKRAGKIARERLCGTITEKDIILAAILYLEEKMSTED